MGYYACYIMCEVLLCFPNYYGMMKLHVHVYMYIVATKILIRFERNRNSIQTTFILLVCYWFLQT